MNTQLTLSRKRLNLMAAIARYSASVLKSLGMILLRIIWTNGVFLLFFMTCAVSIYLLIHAATNYSGQPMECRDTIANYIIVLYGGYKGARKVKQGWARFKFRYLVRTY